jgi:glycosyltransferase involved in cell wall biosynthesis
MHGPSNKRDKNKQGNMMKIAVNTIFLQKDRLEGYGYFVQEIGRRLALKYPEHLFYFLFDREYDPQFIFSENIQPVIIPPRARHALTFRYWYDVSLPLALRKIKPDIVIQPFGFCSMTTKYKQILVVHDLAFLHFPGFISRQHLWYYKWFTGSFIKKANRVVTVSVFSEKDIIAHYPAATGKTDVVFSAAKESFKPIPYTRQQQVKVQYAEGCEYFLFVGGIHPRKNLMQLLKAFSLFKKWQKSNMKLLVAGRLAWKYGNLLEKLETYKHRKDVIMLDYLEETELAEITGAAYALVFPSYFEGFGVPIIEAMQCEVPVITSDVSSMPEIGEDAVLYCDPDNADSIAKQMMQLYKDESLRTSLIEKGKLQAAKFSWDYTADLFWESIEKAVNS